MVKKKQIRKTALRVELLLATENPLGGSSNRHFIKIFADSRGEAEDKAADIMRALKRSIAAVGTLYSPIKRW